MCWWLLTTCLGLYPAAQNNVVVVQAVPAPIVAPLPVVNITTTTTLRPPGNPPWPMTPNNTNPSTGMPSGMPSGMPPGMPSGMPPSMPSGMPPSMPSGMPPSMPSGMPPSMPSGMPSGMPSAMPGLYPSTPAGTPPSMSPSAAPSMPPAMTPSMLPGTNPPATNPPVQGLPLIDPRLGTTPGPYLPPPIMGYSGAAGGNTAVKFPRDKRSIKTVLNSTEEYLESKIRRKRQSCSCVPAGTCTTQGNFGAGMIDFRIVTPGGTGGQCPVGQVYCCAGTSATIACGTRQATPSAGVVPGTGQADYGEYPWQALILTNQNDYVAGGVLVDQYNVLTVVHRLQPYIVAGTVPNVKVRLGEWDAAGTFEPIPYQEYTVYRVFTHPQFNAGTLQYDVAVLRLSRPVPFTPAAGSVTTINRACLPTSSADVFTGQRCWVSGWGKNAFGTTGQYQQILKEVDVPVVDSTVCEAQLRTARLGPTYVLDRTSFICAGGEANKDSCTGDGGSALVCQVGGRWVAAGLVSWGLGCAQAQVPAVYVNVAALLPWIQQQINTT